MSGNNAARVLKATLDSERCTSLDPDHPEIRCFKPAIHKLNWHEAVDENKVSIHSWIDPHRKGTGNKPLNIVPSL